jgi:hypothetical protein
MSPHETSAFSRPGKKLGFVRRLRAKSIGSSSQEMRTRRRILASVWLRCVSCWKLEKGFICRHSCWRMLGVNLEPVVIK